LPPFRWLLGKLLPTPGTGPDLSKAHVERQTFVAIGNLIAADGKKVIGTFVYEGSLYYCCAFMSVEAASVILGNVKTYAHILGVAS
jgi:hypothetical protein